MTFVIGQRWKYKAGTCHSYIAEVTTEYDRKAKIVQTLLKAYDCTASTDLGHVVYVDPFSSSWELLEGQDASK